MNDSNKNYISPLFFGLEDNPYLFGISFNYSIRCVPCLLLGNCHAFLYTIGETLKGTRNKSNYYNQLFRCPK